MELKKLVIESSKVLNNYIVKALLTRALLASFLAVVVLIISSCDRVPHMLRKIETESKRSFWETSARKGDIEGAYKAGKLSCCGDNTVRDDASAINNFCKAAKFWHKPSMFEIGKLYLNEGTPDATIIPYDEAIAYTYFKMASGGGNPQVEWYISNLEPKLDANEKARAEAMIQDFPNVPCELTR